MVEFPSGVRRHKMVALFGAVAVLASLFAVAPFTGAAATEGDVVINEIYDNPPDTDDADAEFLERYNPGTDAGADTITGGDGDGAMDQISGNQGSDTCNTDLTNNVFQCELP